MDLKFFAGDDLEISNGDIATVSDIDLVCQKLIITLRLLKGEWFMDEDYGMDYMNSVFTDKFNVKLAEGMIRSKILAVTGIEKINSLVLTPDYTTRILNVGFDVKCNVGIASGSFSIP